MLTWSPNALRCIVENCTEHDSCISKQNTRLVVPIHTEESILSTVLVSDEARTDSPMDRPEALGAV